MLFKGDLFNTEILFLTGITAGESPPAYLVYATGKGYPPVIESIPNAMKGIATAFMLALLTGMYYSCLYILITTW